MLEPAVTRWYLPGVRRSAQLVAMAILAVACGDVGARDTIAVVQVAPAALGPAPWTDAAVLAEGARFLGDPVARRAALEASLTNHGNSYSRQRLAAYGLVDRGWDALPVWNPRSAPIEASRAAALATGAAPVAPTAPLWDGVVPTTMAGWVALGERVFFGFPLRDDAYVGDALERPAMAAEVGIVHTAAGAVPGVVEFADVDGETRIGITCALCHSAIDATGALVVGRARRAFDYGRMRLAYNETHGITEPAAMVRRLAGWGPGRADVTEDDDEDPVAIPDLWGLRGVAALTQAGTITHGSPMALAIRQETQLLHASHQRIRPPRELAWALAMFVYSLTPPPAAPPADLAAVARGADVFAAHCVRCHRDPDGGGGLIKAEIVGTSAALATGHGRGTGAYRVPALRDVRAGAPYLHDGTIASLDELLSSARLGADYRGGARGPGPVPGHRYGLELAAGERADLLAYLAGL